MNKYITHQTRWILSIGLGILVAFSSWIYLKRAEDRLNANYETTTVLVAKKYIPVGKDVSPEWVEEEKIPVAFVQPTALNRKDELKSPKGKPMYKSRIGLLKGEQVTRSKLADESSLSHLAWIVSPDQTAVSLRLNPEQAVGGHIKPGDWVSVFASFDLQPGLQEPEATLVLARCQIIGVQGQLWDPNGGQAEKLEWKDLSNDFILVTLSVDPAQVGRLMLASDKGRVCLSLLSALSASPVRPPKARLSNILKS